MNRIQKKRSYDSSPYFPLLRGVAGRDGVCSPLTISFLFHFNQNIGPYTTVANLACYAGLLSVLRKHKNKKFNIQVSGTLIESLIQYAPETLKILQEGVSRGQFELLGSTYAQNVPAATDEISNRLQIEQHLEILVRKFHIRPKGFWVPERCWKQSFVKLISDFGYSYTLIEKQTLEKLKLKNYYLPYKTSYQNRSIAIVQDDEHFKQKVNFAIWCGEPGESFQPAFAHLESVPINRDASGSIVVYAEDAEASGLWGYHFGAYPQPVWKNWDILLNRLAEESRFQVSAIGEFLNSVKIKNEIGAIPDGQAEWMVQSLKYPEAPYHEDGFKDWFDFRRRSPKIKKYQKLFHKLSRQIQKAEGEWSRLNNKSQTKPPLTPPFCKGKKRELRIVRKLKALLQEAKLILCRHQYEFGCIGIGEENYQPFDDAKKCLLPLRRFWKILGQNRLKNVETGINVGETLCGLPAQRGLPKRSGWAQRPAHTSESQNVGWIQDCSDSEWEKFRKEIPAKQVWFKNHIAAWIYDSAPEKVVQYRRASPKMRVLKYSSSRPWSAQKQKAKQALPIQTA